MKVYVWLPPQYDDPRYAQTRFPVLELFPGGAGVTYTQWSDSVSRWSSPTARQRAR